MRGGFPQLWGGGQYLTTHGVVPDPLFAFDFAHMTTQQIAFWMWRVSQIRCVANLEYVVPPDPTPTVYQKDVILRKGHFAGTDYVIGPHITEEQYAIGGQGWQYLADEQFWGFGDLGIAQLSDIDRVITWAIQIHWRTFIGSVPGDLFLNPTESRTPPPGYIETPNAVVRLVGVDPITGQDHSQTFRTYTLEDNPPISLAYDWSGTVTFSPYSYYPWKDRAGVPLYDEETGLSLAG